MKKKFPFRLKSEKTSSSLEWHILGGNNKHRIGANSGICIYRDIDKKGKPRKKALLFDAGILFGDKNSPEDPSLFESDVVISDLTRFLYKTDDKTHVPEISLDAIFLTHSHADHLGALPFFVLMGYKLPKIYTTPYTARRLEQEFSNMGLDPSEWPDIYRVAPGKPVIEGDVHINSFWVSHSTPQSVGFFIETPVGNILQPGDFKLDQSVIWGPAFNEEQFHRVVSQPVDLLLLDSTGADRDIVPTTEGDVRKTLSALMAENPNKRFIVAVMSGFEENLASVAKVTAENSRTLWVAGAAHEQALSALKETGMSLPDRLDIDLNLRILGSQKSIKDLSETPAGESVVVVTGAQGYRNAALTRAAMGQHNGLELNPKKDIILFCAPSIPGQEPMREKLLSDLRKKGYQVLTRKEKVLYSQAHARLPEMIEFVKISNPKNILPVHGSEHLRQQSAKVLRNMNKNVIEADNGSVISVSSEKIEVCRKEDVPDANLIGFKTLQGEAWYDRYYLMVKASLKKNFNLKSAANSNTAQNKKFKKKNRRPKIFDIGKK